MKYFFNDLLLVVLKSWQSISQLWLYVLLGVVLSQLMRRTSWTNVVERGCSVHPVLAVVFATVLGVVSPLCTFGTVPVIAQLAYVGVPAAPLVAFLSSSSLMNPQLFIITWGGISPHMAIMRVVAVVVFAIGLGLALTPLHRDILLHPKLLAGTSPATKSCKHEDKSWRAMPAKIGRSLRHVGVYLLLGIVLAAAIEVFVPSRWILKTFRPSHWTSVASAVVAGIPLHACGGGVIPLVRSLMDHGMSEGSALAFFIVGPATRLAPLMGVASVIRPVFVVAYVAVLLTYSFVVGLVYN